MACITKGSSTSLSHAMSFDVFVSFRGTDTRNNFTDHLFAALQRRGVVAFRDNQNINKGQLLEPELFQAINASHLFIVVLSKNYASSSWCLKELTMIVDLVKETGQSVLPIFYDVTPSEVRKQSGEFHKAFARYEESFKDDLEMVQKWREAMKDIANRVGWVVMNKQEHEAIEKIVEEVTNLLDHNQIWSFGDDLVDMHSRVRQLEDLLDLGANEVVRVIGICGMGGIGKTTVATALFHKISSQYHACCFIDDISKIYGELGPIGAQKKLLCQALNQGNMEINNLYHGTKLVRTRLCHLKVLIVLDNVDQDEQLENLALNPKYLGAGSRILIISRDTHILRNYGVNDVYNVSLLNPNKALQLFCRKAFKSDNILNDYEMLTNKVLRYVNGLPLGVKVLGSFLFDRDISEWRSALTRMKENPSKNIMDVLRISFDGLEEIEKEIFLDIACFFSSGYSKWEVKKFLDYRGFYSNIGMEVLLEKSLISCKDWDIIKMHDLLSELGKNIVREKSPKEPINWSRLWDFKDLQNVMIKNEEAKNLEAVVIKQYKRELLETTMTVNVLSKMKHLKLLILDHLNFDGNLSYLSNELRYLSWNKYPPICLPSNFHPDNLVELILHYSNVKQLWKGIKNLPNLRNLDLSYSESLIEMPDLTGAPRLRDLALEGCIKIMRIHPSIGILRELVSLNLRNCKNLFLDLNIIFGLNSLESVNLSGCSKPREAEHLENVDQNRSAIQLSTSSVYQILTLPLYLLSSCKQEDSLHLLLPYLSRFPCLLHLDLSFCNLFQIPDSIGSLQSLLSLNLGGNKFARLPTAIKDLSSLCELNLNHCKQLTYLPELPVIKEKSSARDFRELYVFNCPNLSEMVHIQLFKAFLQSSLFLGRIQIVIPGTQIPRWFNNQNVGSSIKMDLSSVFEDPNWMGVACCALLAAHDDPTNLNDKWQLDYDGDIGYNFPDLLPNQYWVLPILLNNDLVTGGIDHLFILFASPEHIISDQSRYKGEMHDLDKMVFATKIYEHPKGLHLEVKNCGYRTVFKKDLQQFNLSLMFSGNFWSRKRKLLSSD